MICDKCGNDLPEGSIFCNKCGHKSIEHLNEIENTTEVKHDDLEEQNSFSEEFPQNSIQNKVTNKKSRLLLTTSIIVLVLIGIGVGGWFYYDHIKTQEAAAMEEQYETDLKMVVSQIIEESSYAEEIIKLYSDIWNDVIFDGPIFISVTDGGTINFRKSSLDNYLYGTGKVFDDFNDALKYVYDNLKKHGKIDKISNEKQEIEIAIQKLNNPPERYETAFEIAFQLYGFYSEYISLAESPSGSLQTFTNKANQLSSEIIKKFNEFQVRLFNFRTLKICTKP